MPRWVESGGVSDGAVAGRVGGAHRWLWTSSACRPLPVTRTQRPRPVRRSRSAHRSLSGWRPQRTWPGTRATPGRIRVPTWAISKRGAPSGTWRCCRCSAPSWSYTCGGCRRPVTIAPPPSRGGSRCCAGSTAPASSMASWSIPPAEYVRRPTVPPESPTLGLSHLQFEAMLVAARTSANRFDFALVTLLGLLGAADLRGHRLGHRGPARRTRPPGPARDGQGQQRSSWSRYRQPSGGHWTRRSGNEQRGRSRSIRVDGGWTVTPPRGGSAISPLPGRISIVTRTTSWPRTWPRVPEQALCPACRTRR
jgi:hypothetical protein